MDDAMESGQEVEGCEDLAQVEERFRRWRDCRVAGARIPAQLWEAAVAMAKVHGVYRMSKELRLDYVGLKRRVELAGEQVAPTQALQPQFRFVEMSAAPTPTVGSHECVVELHNARGATMRVQLRGAGLSGLAGVCSAFLSAP